MIEPVLVVAHANGDFSIDWAAVEKAAATPVAMDRPDYCVWAQVMLAIRNREAMFTHTTASGDLRIYRATATN